MCIKVTRSEPPEATQRAAELTRGRPRSRAPNELKVKPAVGSHTWWRLQWSRLLAGFIRHEKTSSGMHRSPDHGQTPATSTSGSEALSNEDQLHCLHPNSLWREKPQVWSVSESSARLGPLVALTQCRPCNRRGHTAQFAPQAKMSDRDSWVSEKAPRHPSRDDASKQPESEPRWGLSEGDYPRPEVRRRGSFERTSRQGSRPPSSSGHRSRVTSRASSGSRVPFNIDGKTYIPGEGSSSGEEARPSGSAVQPSADGAGHGFPEERRSRRRDRGPEYRDSENQARYRAAERAEAAQRVETSSRSPRRSGSESQTGLPDRVVFRRSSSPARPTVSREEPTRPGPAVMQSGTRRDADQLDVHTRSGHRRVVSSSSGRRGAGPLRMPSLRETSGLSQVSDIRASSSNDIPTEALLGLNPEDVRYGIRADPQLLHRLARSPRSEPARPSGTGYSVPTSPRPGRDRSPTSSAGRIRPRSRELPGLRVLPGSSETWMDDRTQRPSSGGSSSRRSSVRITRYTITTRVIEPAGSPDLRGLGDWSTQPARSPTQAARSSDDRPAESPERGGTTVKRDPDFGDAIYMQEPPMTIPVLSRHSEGYQLPDSHLATGRHDRDRREDRASHGTDRHNSRSGDSGQIRQSSSHRQRDSHRSRSCC